MAHTFEELVEKQRAADQAHDQVLTLRDAYGRPSQDGGWTNEQTATYDKAWEAWRDTAQAVQVAVSEHAKAEGTIRFDVESKVKAAVRQAAK